MCNARIDIYREISPLRQLGQLARRKYTTRPSDRSELISFTRLVSHVPHCKLREGKVEAGKREIIIIANSQHEVLDELRRAPDRASGIQSFSPPVQSEETTKPGCNVKFKNLRHSLFVVVQGDLQSRARRQRIAGGLRHFLLGALRHAFSAHTSTRAKRLASPPPYRERGRRSDRMICQPGRTK